MQQQQLLLHVKSTWFLVFQDEKWANPEPGRRNLLALSHSLTPVAQASCQPINTLMTYSDRLAGPAGNRGPGEVWSEELIIPHTSGTHVTLSPQRGWGISLLGWWNGMKLLRKRKKKSPEVLGLSDVQRTGTFWASALVAILILGNPCDFGIIHICPLVLTVCIILNVYS